MAGYTGPYTLGNVYVNNLFQRKMVTICTCWERYQIFDMTEEEAVAAGKIIIDEKGNFTLADGTKTSPDSKNWPTRSGVRRDQDD